MTSKLKFQILFLEKPETYNTQESINTIEKHINETIQLNEEIRKNQISITLSRKYQEKVNFIHSCNPRSNQEKEKLEKAL